MPPEKRKCEDDDDGNSGDSDGDATEPQTASDLTEKDGGGGGVGDTGRVDDDSTASANKEPLCDNGGVSGEKVAGPSDGNGDPIAEDGVREVAESTTEATLPQESDKPERKKFRIPGPEYETGTLLFCGGTNWDLIGRRELPKTAKGATGRNLWGPHRLTALEGIRVRLAVSGNSACHTVIVTEDGRVMSWGRNDKGQLGHGDLKRRDVPTLVEGLADYTIVDAACGRSHSLMLSDRGSVFACGDNKMGQCGLGSKVPVFNVPSKIPFKGRPIIKLACGGEFSVILDIKGYLHSFGCPEYGQLGHNTDGQYFVSCNKLGYSCELVPRRVGVFLEKSREGHILPVEDVHIVSVACGTNHTIVMDAKKRCYTWGFGGYGRLGHAEPKDEMVPRLIKFFDGPSRGVKAVYAGGSYSLAISEHGALFFWGQNKPGGDATMYPKPVQDLTGWNIRFAACNNRSIVVVADESVISWGCSPTYGELGYGENKPKSSTTPQEVRSLDGLHVNSVACGYGHTLFIVRDEKEEDQTKLNKLPVYSP